MKSIKYLGVALIATTLLGAAAPAFATEVSKEVGSKDENNTTTTVTITEKVVDPGKEVPKDPDPDPEHPRDDIAVLKFVKAPTAYNFTSKIQTSGTYNITSGDIVGDGFTVFSDAAGAKYQVKSVVKDNKLEEVDDQGTKVNNGLTASVVNFLINNKDINTAGNEVVMSDDLDEGAYKFDHAGEKTKKVESVGINFTVDGEGATKVKDGTRFAGTIENTLYNIYNVAE